MSELIGQGYLQAIVDLQDRLAVNGWVEKSGGILPPGPEPNLDAIFDNITVEGDRITNEADWTGSWLTSASKVPR
jgi:hypothetical protein